MIWTVAQDTWFVACGVLLGYAGLRMLERRYYAQAFVANGFVAVAVVGIWGDGWLAEAAGIWLAAWFGVQTLFEIARQIDTRRHD